MTLSGHQEKWRYNYTHAALAVQVLLNYYTKLDAQIWGLWRAVFWRLFPLLHSLAINQAHQAQNTAIKTHI